MNGSASRLPPCPVCKGVGYVLKTHESGTQWYPLHADLSEYLVNCSACGTEGRMRWLTRHCGLEAQEQRRSLADFQTPRLERPEWTTQRYRALDVLKDAIHKRYGLYTFWGDFGSGKTLALQVAVNELRGEFVEGYYAPFSVIVDHLRQLFATGQDSSAYWSRLLSVPVLALDEISRFDEGRAWIRDRLFVLVDTRYRMRADHLTLFATNDDPRIALPTSDAVGYLFSRMREGQLCELRGDLRAVAKIRY